MKRILFLFSAVLCLGACSVDEQGLEDAKLDIQEINATVVSDGCSITTFNYSTYGKIEVRNDRDFLYVSITASGNNTLAYTALHIANSFAQFPTVGKGNLQPQRMQHQVTFDAGIQDYTFKFPVGKVGENLVIASYTTFGDGTSVWAGDIAVQQGNWSYFNYTVNEHPVNAGPDSAVSLTLSEVLYSANNDINGGWDEIRKLFANQLAPGVDNINGIYYPSIWDLIKDFNTRENPLGDYTTTYTLGTGDCTDSVILTVRVVADEMSL